MSTKIVKIVEMLPAGASGGQIRDRIAMAIGSAARIVKRERGLIIPMHHHTMVKILIEQEYEDGK